ncbi:hypothetical protein DQ04_05271040 [Trypanosoma grayi]|uniref:hypothetical protein n=1 Tax=Trypanosoma grayi TaxID=71804 RepID=UPI0004F42E7D|nr:hypothetical protein DQ04_05271040 [Trypanosoma grayi]KEG09405.1 hypothetical protein DQ04_05271040 [Trypanosoma grayi]
MPSSSSSLTAPPKLPEMWPQSQEQLLPLLDIPDGVTAWDAAALEEERRERNADGHAERLMRTINVLGMRSKQAQGLNAVLTSVARLRENRGARLYLACHEGRGVGILKVGVKKLFVTHPKYKALVELDPLCVLDFFVDTSCQRRGFGKSLFDFMVANEHLTPGEIAIDRPSTKFLAFLQKHYGLVEYTPQSNNFVVFHRYFEGKHPQRGRDGRGGGAWPSASSVGQQNSRRSYPGYNGVKGSSDCWPEPNISRVQPLPLQHAQQGPPSLQQTPQRKTAYELQYEEYMRQQTNPTPGRNVPVLPGHKPMPSAELYAAEHGAKRRLSPTRSGVPYNIISGAPGK